MIAIWNKITNFVFPSHLNSMKEIKDIQQNMRDLSQSNNKRVTILMATLNGDHEWMVKRAANPTQEQSNE